MDGNLQSNGAPSSTICQPLHSSNVHAIARKRRRIILSNRRNGYHHPDKENMPTLGNVVPSTSTTPASCNRRPLIENQSTRSNTAPSNRHVRGVLPQKRPRVSRHPPNNLLKDTDVASTSNASAIPLNDRGIVETNSHRTTEAHSSSEDDINLGENSEDDYDGVDIDDVVDAHLEGDMKEYYSSNTVDRSKIHDTTVVDILTPEFLSALTTSGLPNHHICLKVGTPVMLMRNIDQSEGLCNGTRVMITKMANHVIEAKIMAGKGCGNLVYIPRMDMSPSQSPWPFKLKRRQFPIVVSYAMTINKSQGQSLDTVGLYLSRDVFTHGKIYVSLSRVTTKQGIKILIYDRDDRLKSTTTNVLYKEVFNNI
ncbi:uncharacterized protein LOC131649291 [Vicia villosa]|uniref:uncharacterized protein LOC131649291 n=1 Tax=Vicia villosa TaxID=3911 RepID=UPI00273B777F|nr:uncharacterized protein LOC131649291 [Vicia villosa]